MSNGGRPDGASSSRRSSPIPRGPPTPTSSSPFSEGQRGQHSILASRYTVGAELGRGANGRVFKAFDQQKGRFVAVKKISLNGVSKEQLNGIVGEIELLMNLDHKNIVQYYDSIKSNNHLYIILEYMECGSLAGVIKQTNYGAFSERWVSLYVAQVLNGLKYLHAQGVVHRDIKGANILTTKDMVIKLADFGVAAKLADRGSRGTADGPDKTVAGSPYWMAPEVIELSTVTTAADIWSIGCLIVELLTGSAPYFDCQPLSALFRIVQDKHPPLPEGISVSLRAFLYSCFIKDPVKRPTAAELLKHEWICENQERSVLPNKMPPLSPSPAPSTSSVPTGRSLVERIFQRQMSTRPSKPLSDQTSEIEPDPSPPRSDSPYEHSPSSSALVHETQAVEGTDAEEDSYDRIQRRVSVEKHRRPLFSSPQPPQLSMEKEQGQSRSEPAYSDSSITVGRKREAREDGQMADKDAASVFMGSGTTSPDPRANSPSPMTTGESALVTIFSERVYDFESSIYRTQVEGNWEAYPSSQTSACCEQYDPRDIQKILETLQPHQPWMTTVPALRDLNNLIQDDIKARSFFLHADGLLALLELLLQFDKHVVIEQVLSLSNCVCGDDPMILSDAASLGLAGEVFKFAAVTFPFAVRQQAARFLHSMTFASVRTRDCLIQCQGLRYLILLLDDDDRKRLELKQTAISCLDELLEKHSSMESRVLRMLCMAEMPKRLMTALCSIHQDRNRIILEHAAVPTPKTLPTTATSVARKSVSSLNSLSDACAPRTPSELSSFSDYQQENTTFSTPLAESCHTGEASDVMRSSESHPVTVVESMSEKMMSLLIKVAASESGVHGHLFCPGTFDLFLQMLRSTSKEIVHGVLICLRHLCRWPSAVVRLQQADTIVHLVPLLDQGKASDRNQQIHRDALIVIDTLSKCSSPLRERAVRHGIIPHLCRLSAPGVLNARPDAQMDEMDPRRYSVPLLCRLLVHGSADTRKILWENEVVDLFLKLLKEVRWHQVVLDAVATWLKDDIHQVEDRLVSDESVQTLSSILGGYLYSNSTDISAVLDPLLRMLNRSDKLSREAGQANFAEVILEMLTRQSDAGTCLSLLQSLRRIYGMHPRPKEFINRYGVQNVLDNLMSPSPGDSVGESRVLVRKEAQALLAAFRMTHIW